MISDFENLNLELLNDIDVAVVKFVNILELAAKNSLQLGNMKKKRTRPAVMIQNVMISKRNLIISQTKNIRTHWIKKK